MGRNNDFIYFFFPLQPDERENVWHSILSLSRSRAIFGSMNHAVLSVVVVPDFRSTQVE